MWKPYARYSLYCYRSGMNRCILHCGNDGRAETGFFGAASRYLEKSKGFEKQSDPDVPIMKEALKNIYPVYYNYKKLLDLVLREKKMQENLFSGVHSDMDLIFIHFIFFFSMPVC